MADILTALLWLLIVPGIFATEIYKFGKASTKDIVKGIASYGFASIAIVGNFANSLMNKFDYEPTAALGFPRAVERMVKGKKPRTKIKAGVEAIGYATGLPTQQGWITLSGLYDLLTGETKDIRRLAFSEYQLEGEKKKKGGFGSFKAAKKSGGFGKF